MEIEDNTQQNNTTFDDEKLIGLDESQIAISEDVIPNKQKKVKNKKEKSVKQEPEKQEQKPPYKNVAARRIVLIIGFVVSFIGFGLMLFSLISLLVPNNFASFSLFVPVDLAACGASFIGLVFSVAGANVCKPIARLSFFFAILGFIIAAGMLVVTLLLKLLPLEAIKNILC